jgi:uncharacterized membrane protein YoaT (DUF817 family)
VRDQVSHPYKTTGKIIVMYILTDFNTHHYLINAKLRKILLFKKTTVIQPGEILFQTVLQSWEIHIKNSASARNNKEGWIAMNLAKYIGINMKKKLSKRLITHHATNKYGRVEVYLHAFLTSSLYRDER